MKVFSTFILILVLALPSQATAKTWGPSKPAPQNFDREARLDDLYDKLSKAPTDEASKFFFNEIWLVWHTAPNEAAAEALNRAIRARGGYNFDKAIKILDALIEQEPKFAQAINERSYIYFLKKDYERSLSECERVIELDPRHLGCLSGMARILIRHQRRYKAGKSLLERAIQWHPRIYERVLLNEIPGADL